MLEQQDNQSSEPIVPVNQNSGMKKLSIVDTIFTIIMQILNRMDGIVKNTYLLYTRSVLMPTVMKAILCFQLWKGKEMLKTESKVDVFTKMEQKA